MQYYAFQILHHIDALRLHTMATVILGNIPLIYMNTFVCTSYLSDVQSLVSSPCDYVPLCAV